MCRISTIAVLCIISGPAFGQAQPPAEQGTSPPQAGPVVAGDWTMAAQNDELVVFVKAATPATGPDGYRRLSVRFEFATPQVASGSKAYLSMQVLTEFDCAQGRTRNLESTAYADHNLAAPLGPPRRAAGDWLSVSDGSIAGDLKKHACAS